MRAHSPVRFASAALVFFAMTVASPAFANTLATWTDSTANHAWEIPANWDINQVPNNSSYDVRIATSAPCNLSSQFQIGSLSLSTNTASLSLVPASLLAIDSASGINNSGLIVVNTTAANVATTLRFDINAPITGPGTIQLNGINPGNASLAATGVTVMHNANHTIHGRGDITFTPNQTVFINNGTITADGPNKDPIRLSLSSSSGNQNNGTIQTTSSGALVFDQGFLDQSGGGGIVAGPSSTVTLGANGHMPVIVGGTFATLGSPKQFNRGIIQANSVSLNGCTNLPDSLVQVPAGGLLAILQNGLINHGSVSVNPTNANSPTTFRFDASAAITGAGFISLNGSNPGDAVLFANGVTVTIGPNQQIAGRGDISMAGNNTVLVNNGIISANGQFSTLRISLSNGGNQNNGVIRVLSEIGCAMSFEQGTLDQSGGGSIFVFGNSSAEGRLDIGTVQTFTVIGGSLGSNMPPAPNSKPVINGIAAVLAGEITLSATFVVPANGFTLVTATEVTNYNTITLEANTSLLRFDTSTSIAGPGAISLTNNAKLEVLNNAGSNVTNGSVHTIKGNGIIQIDSGATLANNGIIAPGLSPGALNFSGNLQLSYASNLAFEIGGTNQGTDYDLLHKIDPGTFTLNGKLTVTLTNGFTPAPSDTFNIVTTQSALAGAFTNVRNGARLNTTDGGGSFVVTYSGTNVVLSNFGPPLPAPQLSNISTRVQVLTNDNILIGGFIVTGSDPKKVIVRGIGPSLSSHGVPNALADPTIELHNGSGVLVATNDNWKDSQQTEIQNTGLAPSNDLESAIVATLPANNSAYTAVLRGKNNSTGVGLVEIYDLNPSANSKLANLSSRGFVGTGDNVMIGGVIIGADTANGATVLIRGIGPQLTRFGIPNALSDPIMELHDRDGNSLAVNDNWKDTQQAAIQEKIPPADDRESAILVTLAPGNYTAILRGVNDGTGNALVEVYNFP
jgi:hypothetical protein